MTWNIIQDLILDIIPVDLYNNFHATLSENNKAYHIIPIDKKRTNRFFR